LPAERKADDTGQPASKPAFNLFLGTSKPAFNLLLGTRLTMLVRQLLRSATEHATMHTRESTQ